MYKRSTIGIIIPAYNEEKLILKTLEGIPSYVDKIYVTDDCSTDKTSEIVLSFNDSRVELTRHDKNTGVGGAIVSGFKKALRDNIDVISIMAGDNQMDHRYLPNLLLPIINGETDFTKGNRLKRNYWVGMSPFRLFGNKILSLLNKIVSGYWNISDPQNGYIAISSSCLKQIDLDSLYEGYAFENDLMIKANVAKISMRNVLIPARYGDEQSKIVYWKFIFRMSHHLGKSYFWRMWNKYFKRATFVGFSLIVSLLLLLGGLVYGVATNFADLSSIIMPIISTSFFSLGMLADVLNGFILSIPKQHTVKIPKIYKEEETLVYHPYPIMQQVYFR
ncbi:MAG: glycosyltransferase family 2 protein [Candidatus Heimdallarchaeota archaeon]